MSEGYPGYPGDPGLSFATSQMAAQLGLGGFYGGCFEEEENEEFDREHQPSSEYPEYTEKELHSSAIEFIRPGFDTEGKYIHWCLYNGFEEVSEGVWAGHWYWDRYGGSIEDAKTRRLERRARKLAEFRAFKDKFQLSDNHFQILMELKEAGNNAFKRKEFSSALEKYHSAANLVPAGRYLDGDQRVAALNVYSNLAECLLRLKDYMKAIEAASRAIIIDPEHVKSLFRRAKAYYAVAKNQADAFGLGLTIGKAIEDVDAILHPWRRDVVDVERDRAQQLKDEMEATMTDALQQGRGF